MPWSCCSMICVVVLSSVVASAPGNTALTPICGGGRAGNWAVGSERAESSPNSMTRIARTPTKIGRAMKESDKRGAAAPRELRLHGNAGVKQRTRIDDHLVTRLESAGDEPVGSDRAPGLDHPQLGHIVLADDDDGRTTALVAADGALGHQDAAGLHALAEVAA